jgi:ribosome biogenesis GTPase
MASRERLDDEDRIRVRPNPRGSRPRSKERPEHRDAISAQVVSVDRGRYGCLIGSFAQPGAAGDQLVVSAMKARELGRASVVVGDRVALVGDVSGVPGTLARIVRVEDRESVLRRSSDDVDPVERVIVANADQLAVVTALADPEPRHRMVDRCLVAAYDAGLEPLLVLTKADLAEPGPFVEGYRALAVPWLVTYVIGRTINGLGDLRDHLHDRVTVFIGHSGVGKSTLVNALVPGSDRAVGEVNEVTGRGRHTSASAIALELPDGGWVVDTPGVRSFGLAHVGPDDLLRAFPDLAAGTGECPRGCTHDEPECGIDEWVAQGHAGPGGPARLESLRRLLRAREAGPSWGD